MKKVNLYLVGACIALLTVPLDSTAAPIGNSNLGREYLYGSTGLEKWSTGLFGGTGERRLSRDGRPFDMDFTRGMAYVGYDVQNWVTFYTALGIKDVEFNNVDADDSTTEFGVGLQFNLLDQEIMDSPLMEDRLRVNTSVYVGFNQADWQSDALEWVEFSGDLTVSLVNDLDGNPYYVPMSIAVYAGPAYSHLASDDFDTEEEWGFTGGLQIFLTKRVTLDLSVTKYDEPTFSGSANIRF